MRSILLWISFHIGQRRILTVLVIQEQGENLSLITKSFDNESPISNTVIVLSFIFPYLNMESKYFQIFPVIVNQKTISRIMNQ